MHFYTFSFFHLDKLHFKLLQGPICYILDTEKPKWLMEEIEYEITLVQV